ncbi:hypothetical protein QE452_001863 [Sphingomonas sp. SORGH_AS438]|nr:hypothetical protein [Sphingomonas sp. SORGH_AS_0438]
MRVAMRRDAKTTVLTLLPFIILSLAAGAMRSLTLAACNRLHAVGNRLHPAEAWFNHSDDRIVKHAAMWLCCNSFGIRTSDQPSQPPLNPARFRPRRRCGERRMTFQMNSLR